MAIPDYWLERPPLSIDRATYEAVESFLADERRLAEYAEAVMTAAPWPT